VVSHTADVDGRHREFADLPASARDVEFVDGRWVNPDGLRDFPDEPARVFAPIVVAEDGGMRQRVQMLRLEQRFVCDVNQAIDDLHGTTGIAASACDLLGHLNPS
jgi:hypothetical protein